MRNSRLWARMLAVESGTVIEGISWEENPGPDGEPEITVIARVRPHRRRAGRCGICGAAARAMTRASGAGGGPWTWARSGPSWKAPRRGCPAPGTA